MPSVDFALFQLENMSVGITTALVLFAIALKSELCLADTSPEPVVTLGVTQILALSKKIEQIESRVAHQDSIIRQLQQESEVKDALIKDLQERLDNVENSQTGGRKPVEDGTTGMASPKEGLQTIGNEANTNASSSFSRTHKHPPRIMDKKLSRERRLDPADGEVAFHARLKGSGIEHVYPGEHIMFNDVRLNLGNAYYETHGVFIAPKGGLYLFSASLLSSGRPYSYTEVEIVRNIERLALVCAYGGAANQDQGSATVVTVLDEDDEVWVRAHVPGDTTILGCMATTFSGVLITAW